ncbi:sugar phosphate isomerase/epimerase family protein [Candidatus Latescibacterota bacterium]
MKLAYGTWGMPMLPIDTAVEHLAKLGFDGVEIAVIRGFTTELDTLDAAERQRIRQLVDQHGLYLTAVAGHQSLLARDEDAHAEAWRRLTGSVDLCVDWAGPDGPPPLVSVVGTGPGDWESHRDFILERLGTLVDYCASRQVVLALEPHVGDGMTELPKVLELMRLVDSPWCRLNFDISHFEVVGIPTADTVAALTPYAVHTHVKDQRGLAPDFSFLIPGEGDFDYVAYLTAMDKAGYTGYITAEVSMQVHKRPNYDPLAAATLTYQTLNAAFQQAGLQRG